MADTKISALTAATDLTGAVVPVVQGGVTKKADVALFGFGAPVTKTADFTLAATETSIINDKVGSTCVGTLSGGFAGRQLYVKNTQAQQLDSASANVVPKAGGAAGTAILSAASGAWAFLIHDGTNWVIMASGT